MYSTGSPVRQALRLGTIAVLTVVVVATIAYRIQEREPRSPVVPDPRSTREPAPIDAPARIEAALVADDEISPFMADASFLLEQTTVARRHGEVIGVRGRIILPEPRQWDGPWRFLECQGTRQLEERGPWESVQAIAVTVSDQGVVLKFAPALPHFALADLPEYPRRVADEERSLVIRALPSGETLWSSLLPQASTPPGECPPGFEDE